MHNHHPIPKYKKISIHSQRSSNIMSISSTRPTKKTKISFINLNKNILTRSLSGSQILNFPTNNIYINNINCNDFPFQNGVACKKPFSGNYLSSQYNNKAKPLKREINKAKTYLKVNNYPYLKIYCKNMLEYYNNPIENCKINNINSLLLQNHNKEQNQVFVKKIKLRFNSPLTSRTGLLSSEYNSIVHENTTSQIINNSTNREKFNNNSVSPIIYRHILGKPFSSQSTSRINIQLKNKIDVGLCDNIGCRKQMEDYSIVIHNYIKNQLYCAIFDGHGGKFPAEYCKQHLHEIIEQNILKYPSKSIDKNINKSFEIVNSSIIDAQDIPEDSGTTASVIILNNKEMICANVGDSRCYLIKKNKSIIPLTPEHNCSNDDEVSRVRQSKGVIFQKRVFGKLALTRSIGDKEMKNYGVIAFPSINKLDVNKKEDFLVVMGSDGVWDTFNEDKLRKVIFGENWSSAKEMAKIIVERSIKEGSGDNITCIVIKF